MQRQTILGALSGQPGQGGGGGRGLLSNRLLGGDQSKGTFCLKDLSHGVRPPAPESWKRCAGPIASISRQFQTKPSVAASWEWLAVTILRQLQSSRGSSCPGLVGGGEAAKRLGEEWGLLTGQRKCLNPRLRKAHRMLRQAGWSLSKENETGRVGQNLNLIRHV